MSNWFFKTSKLWLFLWLIGSAVFLVQLHVEPLMRGRPLLAADADWSNLLITLPLIMIGIMSRSWFVALVLAVALSWWMAPNQPLQLTSDARD